MRVLLHILLAFSCQLLAVSCQQTSCTVPEPVEGTTSSISTSSATAYPTTVDRCQLTVDYYESQIRLADSLYKNYLPQYNFEQVKAAVGFFDSLRLSTDNSQQTLCNSDAYPRTVDCCPLTVDIEFLCARAHYYHAVGLTERDDIVGACEHYLTALEIMEEMMAKDKRLKANGKRQKAKERNAHDSKPETQNTDYEKIRFMALIYTRLGELFYNENYYEIALNMFKRSHHYIKLTNGNMSEKNILRNIGNTYHLSNNLDSALCYYNKSLLVCNDLTSRLDVEKSIAQVLYYKGEKDSAYNLIKNNLDKIEDYIPKFAYFATLGDMFYGDMKYDSAIYYLEKSVLSNDFYTKYLSATELSVIYDSLDNLEMKSYYDNMVSKLSNGIINSSVEKNSLLTAYNAYKQKMHKKEMLGKQRKIKQFYAILANVLILSIVVIVLIRYRSKRKEKEISEAYSESKKNIADKEIVINKIIESIRQMESEIDEYNRTKENEIRSYLDEIKSLETEICLIKSNLENFKFKNSLTEGRIRRINAELRKKEELIDTYKHEISVLKNRLEIMSTSDVDDNFSDVGAAGLELYLRSKVCSKILDEINELYAKNRNTNELTPLTHDEFVMLLRSAIRYMDKFADMVSKYRELKKDDLYYLSLAIIGLKDKQIASLFSVTYNAIKTRRNKICSILEIRQNELKIFLLNICS